MRILSWFNSLKAPNTEAATNEYLYLLAVEKLNTYKGVDFNLIAKRALHRISENEEVAATILDKSPSLFQGNNSNLIWLLEKNEEDSFTILNKLPSEVLDPNIKERIYRVFSYCNSPSPDNSNSNSNSIFAEVRQKLNLQHENHLKEFYKKTSFWWIEQTQ